MPEAQNYVYMLELQRWNVKNDATEFTSKTESTNNSIGINNAMSWASQQGYAEMALPKGTYLIDEQIPVKIPSYMTFNLNSSRLRIRDNNLEGYQIIQFDGVNSARLTNGIIEGDKDTHTYTIDGIGSDTHESGTGVHILGSKSITIDNLEIFNLTGDAVTSINKGGNMAYYLRKATSESGSYDLNTGAAKADAARIRWTNKLNLSDPVIANLGYFSLAGNGYGGLGSGITATHYDVIFYNADDTFHSSAAQIEMFSRVEVPKQAKWAKFSLYQATIPEDANNWLMIWNFKYTEQIFIEKNNLHHCRRQGMSLGGQYIHVTDNEIHHIKGTAPQGGIDIEDGADFNQHFFIERNHFHHNQGFDLVITNGKHMKIMQNRFNRVAGVSLAVNEPADRVLINGNSFHQTFVAIAGEQIISDNLFYACEIQLNGGISGNPRPMVASSNMFHNSRLTVNVSIPNIININGCRFYNDTDKWSVYAKSNTLSLIGEPQNISNCTFDGADKGFLNSGTSKGGWIFSNCTFLNLGSASHYGLAPGTYTECSFLKIKQSLILDRDEYNFINCKISVDSTFNTNLAFIQAVNLKALRIIDCMIDYVGGYGLKVENVTDEVILIGNKLYCTGAADNKAMIRIDPSFSGNRIMIDGNKFSSVNARKAIDNFLPTASSSRVTVKHNIIWDSATFDLRDKELKVGNIVGGVIDPYYNRASPPTFGFYRTGQEIKNSAPAAGGFYGWVCTKEGYADKDTWSASTLYNTGLRIAANGHVYEAQTAGRSAKVSPAFPTGSGASVNDTAGTTVWITRKAFAVGDQVLPTVANGSYYECTAAGISGAVEPKWTTVISSTVNDGSIVWKCVRPFIIWKEIGVKAEFKSYGAIST